VKEPASLFVCSRKGGTSTRDSLAISDPNGTISIEIDALESPIADSNLFRQILQQQKVAESADTPEIVSSEQKPETKLTNFITKPRHKSRDRQHLVPPVL